MISHELLAILCCPETKQSLTPANEELISKINQRIESGMLKNRRGAKVTQKMDGGLIRSDHKYFYPIRQDIPVMLVDEAIPLDSL